MPETRFSRPAKPACAHILITPHASAAQGQNKSNTGQRPERFEREMLWKAEQKKTLQVVELLTLRRQKYIVPVKVARNI
jgi:hypothetical protein